MREIPGSVLQSYALEDKEPIYLDRNRLREIGEDLGVPSHLIDGPDQVDLAWFETIESVARTGPDGNRPRRNAVDRDTPAVSFAETKSGSPWCRSGRGEG